jgi:hypothetical protein
MTAVVLCISVVGLTIGIFVYSSIVKSRPKDEPPPEKKSDDPEKESPTPTPAPVTAPRSYSWIWWLIIIIAVVFIGRWAWYETQGVKSAYSPPQATAPRTEMRQNVPFRTSADLMKERSIGVEVSNRGTKIHNGGGGLYFAEIPQKFSGTVYFKGYITRYYDGQLILRVNGTEFRNLHKGGGRFWKVFSFPASVLHSGTNTFILSSPGEDILVEKMEIEVS